MITRIKQGLDSFRDSYLLMLITGFMFFAPVSSSIKTVFIFLLLLAVLWYQPFRFSFFRQFRQPVVILAYTLYALLLLACLWSPASFSQQMLVLNKYSKLLFFPVLIVAFEPVKNRVFAIRAFLAAMFITGVLACLQKFSLLDIHGNGYNDPAFVFQSHIMTSFLFAFAAFLSFCIYMKQSEIRATRMYLWLTLFFSCCVFFFNTGRTGYFIYLLLAVFFCFQYLNLKRALLAGMVCLAAFSLLYWQSPLMKKNINQLASSYQHFNQNKKDTSLGFRIQFHQFAAGLVKKSPWIGEGTGSFAYWYDKDKPIKNWKEPLREPHSEYWMIAVQTGLAGLIVLLGLFFTCYSFASRLKQSSIAAKAMVLAFMVGCLTDSLLFYGGPGYFFIAFTALFYAEHRAAVTKLRPFSSPTSPVQTAGRRLS